MGNQGLAAGSGSTAFEVLEVLWPQMAHTTPQALHQANHPGASAYHHPTPLADISSFSTPPVTAGAASATLPLIQGDCSTCAGILPSDLGAISANLWPAYDDDSSVRRVLADADFDSVDTNEDDRHPSNSDETDSREGSEYDGDDDDIDSDHSMDADIPGEYLFAETEMSSSAHSPTAISPCVVLLGDGEPSPPAPPIARKAHRKRTRDSNNGSGDMSSGETTPSAVRELRLDSLCLSDREDSACAWHEANATAEESAALMSSSAVCGMPTFEHSIVSSPGANTFQALGDSPSSSGLSPPPDVPRAC